ncbi:MAG: hypothetical protein JJU28_04055 [Cyclobacteriaceae bacterium]|nr:hypothetical protein [Cyclobacteriaceae bacterium]
MAYIRSFFLLALSMTLIQNINAQTAVALHSAGEATFFYQENGLQLAYQNAVHGDTIYLPGGSFSPPSNFAKRLVILGAGFHPQGTEHTGKTFINGNFRFAEGADQLYIEGVHITGYIDFPNNISINQVIIKNTQIGSYIYFYGSTRDKMCKNITIINCAIGSDLYMNNAELSTVSNSVIGGRLFNSDGNMFSNNIFLFINATNISTGLISTCDNNVFKNNIFRQDNFRFMRSCTGNILSNNIIAASNPDLGTNPTLNNNWLDVDLSTVFEKELTAAFDYDNSYKLKSPHNYIGDDGKEVGLFGGLFPYKENAIPQIPRIVSKKIAGTTDAEGLLKIEITVEAQP